MKKSLYEREVEAREDLARATRDAAAIEAYGKVQLHKAQEKSRLKEEKRLSRIDAFQEISEEFERIKEISNPAERIILMQKLTHDLLAMNETGFITDSSMEAKNELRLRQSIKTAMAQTPMPSSAEAAAEALNYFVNYASVNNSNRSALLISPGELKVYFSRFLKFCNRAYGTDPMVNAALIEVDELKKGEKKSITVLLVVLSIPFIFLAIYFLFLKH